MADSDKHRYTLKDSFKVGLMNLHGCSGFALDVGDSLAKLAYIEPVDQGPREEGYNPYHSFYNIRLLTFHVLDDAVAYTKENVTKDLDLKYPKTLKLATGTGLTNQKERIEAALGFELEQEEDPHSLGQGLLYGVKRFGKKFFKDMIHSPQKQSVPLDLEKYKVEVANYQSKMDAEPEEQDPDPSDCEKVWKQEEKHQKDHLPSLAVSMDESKFTLAVGEHEVEDIPVKEPADAKDIVNKAVTIAREKKAKGVYFHGDFCRENRAAMVEALKTLPILDMQHIGAALTSGITKHEGYLKVIGCLMAKVHFMRLLMICPCPDPPPEMPEPEMIEGE